MNERKAQIRAQRVKVFSSVIVKVMTTLKVVHFDIKELISLNILSVLFEAIELNEAIKEDALT